MSRSPKARKKPSPGLDSTLEAAHRDWDSTGACCLMDLSAGLLELNQERRRSVDWPERRRAQTLSVCARSWRVPLLTWRDVRTAAR
jgi:hypothetical protein